MFTHLSPSSVASNHVYSYFGFVAKLKK